MRRFLLLIVAVVMAAGCSAEPVIGSASPSPATPSAEQSGLVLPPRPYDIPLDNVDPCALLTPEQRTELGLTDKSSPSTSTAPGFEGPTCGMLGFEPRAVTLSIALSVRNSISVLTTPGATRDQLEPVTVGGFPAVLGRPYIVTFCSVDIDVAEGQFIDIQFSDGGRVPPVSQDDLCRDVVPIAEQVMQTLLGT